MIITENSDFSMRLKLAAFEENFGSLVSPNWERVKVLLGPRVDFMRYLTYPRRHDSPKTAAISNDVFDCYAVDIFAGNGRSTLGLEVASALTVMFPNFQVGSMKIIFSDHADLKGLPSYLFYSTTDKMYKVTLNIPFYRYNTPKSNTMLAVFEDERYVVTLLGDDTEVLVDIFKK